VRLISVLGLLAGALIATPVSAEETFLTLVTGTAHILRTTQKIGAVIIGNPAIVDANMVGDGIIALTAKASGSTNMILLDDKQAVILQRIVQVGSGARSMGVQVLSGDKAEDYSCSPICTLVSSASGSSNGDTTASGPFRNCAAARAAGASSIPRGESGYSPHLDADNDGIACEPPPINTRAP